MSERFTPYFTILDEEKGTITRFDIDSDGKIIKEYTPKRPREWWSDKRNRMITRKELNEKN